MPRLQADTALLLAKLQEASDLAKTITLPDGLGVGPILAAMVEDLRDPIVRPAQSSKHKPQEYGVHAGQ